MDAALRFLAARGVGWPVVSRGAEGLRFLIDGEIGAESRPVEHPRILVGAGDAAMAGLAVALQRRMAPLDAIGFALAVAAAHVEGSSVLSSRDNSRSPVSFPAV